MLVTSVYAFRFQDAQKYRAEKHDQEEHESSRNKESSLAIFKHSATWICAAYFLAYVGIEGKLLPVAWCPAMDGLLTDCFRLNNGLDCCLHDPRAPRLGLCGQHMLITIQHRHGSGTTILGYRDG